MQQVNRWLSRTEEALIVLFLAGMCVITFVQVILRYVFNSGFGWAVEATTYMFGWMVLIGLAYGVRESSHIGVDIWVKKLGPKAKKVTALVGAALCLLYAALLIVGAFRYETVMYQLGVEADDIAVQRWVLLGALPIGFILLLVRLLEVTWRIWTGKQSGLLGDEAEQHIRAMRAMDALTGKAPR